MFRFGQICNISAPISCLENTIEYIFKIEGQDKYVHDKRHKVKTIYQITKDNEYFCLGWAYEFDNTIPDCWNNFEEDFKYYNAANMISEFINNYYNNDIKDNEELGFIADINTDGIDIENKHHAIVYFKPCKFIKEKEF